MVLVGKRLARTEWWHMIFLVLEYRCRHLLVMTLRYLYVTYQVRVAAGSRHNAAMLHPANGHGVACVLDIDPIQLVLQVHNLALQ